MSRLSWCVLAAVALGMGCGGSDGKGGGADALDGGAGSDGNNGSDGSDGTGGGDGPVGETEDGGFICERLAVRADPTTPDMLIVLDRSASMKRNSTNRWDPSVSAVKTITSDFDAEIRFGLMMFPAEGGFGNQDACLPGTLEVKPAVGTSGDIATALDSTQPGGGTPTSATLDEALKQFSSSDVDIDAPPAPQFVLLVTDGQPTCPNGEGSANASSQELAQDRALTVTAIDALRDAGVKTYVISYDDALDQSLIDALTEFAEHGGTNEYHAVQDETELLAVFKKIAGEVVSCSFTLEKAPPDPSYVQVTLDGKQLNLDDKDGWTIKEKVVTVQGAACESLQDGGEHVLSAEVLCEVVVPI